MYAHIFFSSLSIFSIHPQGRVNSEAERTKSTLSNISKYDPREEYLNLQTNKNKCRPGAFYSVFPDSTQCFPHNPKLLKFICPLSNKRYLAINHSYNDSFVMHLLLGMETLILSRFLFFLLASVVLILTRQLGKKKKLEG